MINLADKKMFGHPAWVAALRKAIIAEIVDGTYEDVQAVVDEVADSPVSYADEVFRHLAIGRDVAGVKVRFIDDAVLHVDNTGASLSVDGNFKDIDPVRTAILLNLVEWDEFV